MKWFLLLSLVLFSVKLMAIDYGMPAENYDSPLREVSLIISPEGYYPQNITVFQGEEVKFYLTNSTPKQSCMILKEKNIFLSSKIGEISEGKATFNELGTFQFYCPTGKISGKITVMERPSDTAKREIASQKKKQTVRFWLPKDE